MSKIKPWDYHIHTKLCGHAYGEMEDYVLAGIENGLGEMGFSDHIPWEYLPDSPYIPRKEYGMPKSKLEWYFSEVERLKKKYKNQISLKSGMEIDFFGWSEPDVIKFINENNGHFDYVIGSVHMIESPGIGIWPVDDDRFYKFEEFGVDNAYDLYFEQIIKLVETDAYDILGHLDLVKRYGFRHSDRSYYLKRISEILDLIKESEMVIELNVAGLRKFVKEIYPEEEIIKMIATRDIPMTVSSDSHKAEFVGANFSEFLTKLKNLGIKRLCKFEKRNQIIISIDDVM